MGENNDRDQYDDGYKQKDSLYSNYLKDNYRSSTDEYKHEAEDEEHSADVEYQKPHLTIRQRNKGLGDVASSLSPNEHTPSNVNKRSLYCVSDSESGSDDEDSQYVNQHTFIRFTKDQLRMVKGKR